MSEQIKFRFFRDRFGVHVYYPAMNSDAVTTLRHRDINLMLNGTIEFDRTTSAVVPPVERLSSVTQEKQTVGYTNKVDNSKMTAPVYLAERARLKHEMETAKAGAGAEEEIRTSVAFRRFTEEWVEDTQMVDIHTDYEFEIIDIAYAADDRMVPMRHYDESQINYFTVDGKEVLTKFIHELCQAEGLRHEDSSKRGTYFIPSWGPRSWKLEGRSYTDPLNNLDLHEKFKGDLDECKAFIKTIEQACRQCLDEWNISHRQPTKMTVQFVTDNIMRIIGAVQQIDTKVRTKKEHSRALDLLQRFKTEALSFGLEDMMAEEVE